MLYKDNDIDLIRDAGIALENSNLKLSYDLMVLALKCRPAAYQIMRKIKQYEKTLKIDKSIIDDMGNNHNMTDNDIDRLKEAALSLEDINLKMSFDLMNIVLRYRPNALAADDPALKKYKNSLDIYNFNQNQLKHSDHKIEKLENILKQQTEQLELLRNKFNQIHEALNYSDVLKIREIDDPSAKLSPVEIINKNAKKTLIVFGGMALKPSMPPKEFFKTFMKKNINVIFVKDFEQCWYQKGLLGKSHDLESTYRYLKSIIPKETEHLISIGTSAGGYAAIRFGVQLKAERILAFAPQTNITRKIFQQFKSLDSRIGDLDLDSDTDLDLSKYLSKNKIESKIELYYGKYNRGDELAATNIKEYITIHTYPTGTHMIATYLKNQKLLDKILESI